MVVVGIVMAILGTVFGLAEMHIRLHVDFVQQGNILMLLYLGLFLCTFIVGPLIDAAGNKLVLTTSSFLVLIAMAGFAAAHSFGGAAACAVLLGLGGGGLNIATNALVSDLFEENRGPMLNLLGLFYGIGALFIPLFAAVIAGHLTIEQMLLSCAGLAAACIVFFAVIPFPPVVRKSGITLRETLQVASYPGVWLLAFVLFCQAGNEAAVNGWTSTYSGTRGLDPRTATFVLSGYWAAVMGGRLLATQILSKIEKAPFVLLCALMAVVGSGTLLFARSLMTLVIGVLLIGVSYAGIFPTVLAIAGDSYRKMAGTVFGFLFAVGMVGGMAFPWAVGQLSQRLSVRWGMLVPLLGAVGICLLATAIWARLKDGVPSHDGATS